MKTIGNANLYMITVIAVLMAVTVGFTPSRALARECFTQYGGGEICTSDNPRLEVNKEVYNPDKKKYQDNIKKDEHTFEKSDRIYFKIKVKNTGDIEIKNIDLVDNMPSILEYSKGDGDDSNDGTKVSFDDFDLKPGESETFEFSAKVKSTGIDPDEDYVCVANVAKAKGERKDNGEKEDDADYANFCIEMRRGRVLSLKESITRLPTTGFIDLNTALIGSTSIGLILLGLGLRKIAKSEE